MGRIMKAQGPVWLGLTDRSVSVRPYSFGDIRKMVSRSAYAQLGYSPLQLAGTVIGMIEIFGSQAPTGNNPALLAHGISVALYNTAFGLMIAIPSLMFYRYFRGLVDAYTLEMEQASDRLVPHLMRFAVPRGG